MHILRINNLTKIYGSGVNKVHALNEVNINVEEGEFISIMGPSGSGKTTLLNIIAGLDNPTKGEIFIRNKKIDSLNEDELAIMRRKSIGFIFQDFNIMESLTVKENIALPLIIEKIKADIIEKEVNKIIRFLEVEDIQEKYPSEISGGQKQRTAIGRSLIIKPEILIADEPTGNLDTKSTNNIMKLFARLNKEKNATILMVTHDPIAASYCKKLIFIEDGKINSQLNNKENSRKSFYDKILSYLLAIGDGKNADI